MSNNNPIGSRPARLIPWFVAVTLAGTAAAAHAADAAPASAKKCGQGDTGITLSPGFCATIFADNVGHARHLVVAPNGVVYVNTWSGVYYNNDKPPAGGFLVALKDTKGTGHADVQERFGDGVAQGSAGGTGIALYKGAIYAEQNDKIIRYALTEGSLVPKGGAEVVVSGMPLGGDHPMHPFVIDPKGNLFVDMGSATNTCEEHNRMPGSKGLSPCKEQETRGGTWRFDASKLGQKFSPAERYATGIRNGEGFSFDAAGNLYVTQHGRDQLTENWPALYKPEQGHELPAEEVVELKQGGDYGWPRCYFDGAQKKLVLAPEYGGDGGKTVGECANKIAPVAWFPAHWAPNDMVFYNAVEFPKPYRGGAFIAFHGSWNRAPAPQEGYNVVYQPFADGKAAGQYVVFADGFAGKEKAPGRAAHRPSGLAVAPDGALFITDDMKGRIWRVTYDGTTPVTQIASAPAPKTNPVSGMPLPPEGIHPDAGRQLRTPPGATAAQVALGDQIFHGQVAGGTCAGCHASDAKGTQLGADLTKGTYLWSDGSLRGLTDTITKGVPAPKHAMGAMPPMGGSQLSKDQVTAVAAYVWAVGHSGHQP